MKAYIAIKFKEDYSDRKTIENLSNTFNKMGVETIVMVRDHEKWGKIKFTPKELMTKTFKAIDLSDLLIIEFSEKGTGLGIEAGYAYAKRKPIFVIAKEGSDISSTLKGVAKEVIFYNKPEELFGKLNLNK